MIKDIKKFIKEHKKEVIGGVVAVAGMTVLIVFGVKHRTPKLPVFTDVVDQNTLDLVDALDRSAKGCTMYVPMTLEEMIVEIDNARMVDNMYLLEAGNKKLFKVENVIAFGNLVEP